jgi:hypothetical protein
LKLHFRESAHSYRYFHFPIYPVHPLDKRHEISRNLLLGNLHKEARIRVLRHSNFLVHPRRSSPSAIIFACLPKPSPCCQCELYRHDETHCEMHPLILGASSSSKPNLAPSPRTTQSWSVRMLLFYLADYPNSILS